MPYWKCYYHVIWATKNRESVISPAVEMILFQAIRSKSDELHCPILAVNGTADHIHVAVCVRPSLATGDWVGQVKGASSRAVNLAFDERDVKFRWQADYGILTFGEKQTPFIVGYIENQKEHHRTGNLQPSLERIED